MARHITTGIDIGTSWTRVVIAEEVAMNGRSQLKVIGTGQSESKGVHEGYIANHEEATRSLLLAVRQAEKMAGVQVKRAYASVGGIGLSGVTATGSAIVSRADLEITPLDLDKAGEAAETAIPHAVVLNKKIINTIPVEYKTDGKVVWGRVQGLKAQKVDVKVLFIMCLEHHIQDLIKTIEDAGIEVTDVVAAPIAASFVTLSKKQKKAGCVLVNLGAETLSMVVYENSNPISLEVFPIGGTDITNDIALGLKVGLEEAESIKLGAITNAVYSKKKLEDIIHARLSDCLELIEGHLKRIGRNALLPAGVIIIGGGSSLHTIRGSAETSLKLPAHLGDVHFGEEKPDQQKEKTKDSSWATAYGLALLGFNTGHDLSSIGPSQIDKITKGGKTFFSKVGEWISQFLP
ncbi:MAG: cell division protein FtsA, cell division protein FtsA [Parcubacteria group bacterium]|nr:cell division protein FtsA, cell division protein FtsA [Parcubacteria group bacterium]